MTPKIKKFFYIFCIFIFLVFVGFVITILHEAAHAAIYNNYGVDSKIKIGITKAYTVGNIEQIKNLSQQEILTLDFLHGLNEVIFVNILIFFVLMGCAIIISEILSKI